MLLRFFTCFFLVPFAVVPTAVSVSAGTPEMQTDSVMMAKTAIDCSQEGGQAPASRYVVQKLTRAGEVGVATMAFTAPNGEVVDNFKLVLSRSRSGNWSCTGGNEGSEATVKMLEAADVGANVIEQLVSENAKVVLGLPVNMENAQLRYVALAPPSRSAPIQYEPPLPAITLLNRLWNSANQYRGTSTDWPGTDHGRTSCAQAAKHVVYNATGTKFGSLTYLDDWANVDKWWHLARSGGGSYGGKLIAPQKAFEAHRGAIVIWDVTSSKTKGHIGFCAVDGCRVTWSNSSKRAVFAPTANDVAGLYFFGEYDDNTTEIWEPSHIP